MPTDFQLQHSVQESYYDPHIYLLRGRGFLWYTALTRAQIHRNALNIFSEFTLPLDFQGLSELCKEVQVHENDDSTLFTYKAYYKLLHNALDEVGINDVPHQTGSRRALNPSQKKTMNELLCYIWHTLAGPICNYLNNPLFGPLFKYWFPETDDFYTTARHFLEDNTEQVTSDQTALIPWVQSIVIQHYVLGKMVFFQDKDNYIDLYWYLDDFIALYLSNGLNCTMGDDI